MRNYDKPAKKPAYFFPGFRLGIVFGVLGALIMLGRRGTARTTL